MCRSGSKIELEGAVCLVSKNHTVSIRPHFARYFIYCVFAWLGLVGGTDLVLWMTNRPSLAGNVCLNTAGLLETATWFALPLAAFVLIRLLWQPSIDIQPEPRTVDWKRGFKTGRYPFEALASVRVSIGTKVYYGANHLVDFKKVHEQTVHLELVFGNKSVRSLGKASGRDAHRRARLIAKVIAEGMNIPIETLPDET